MLEFKQHLNMESGFSAPLKKTLLYEGGYLSTALRGGGNLFGFSMGNTWKIPTLQLCGELNRNIEKGIDFSFFFIAIVTSDLQHTRFLAVSLQAPALGPKNKRLPPLWEIFSNNHPHMRVIIWENLRGGILNFLLRRFALSAPKGLKIEYVVAER